MRPVVSDHFAPCSGWPMAAVASPTPTSPSASAAAAQRTPNATSRVMGAIFPRLHRSAHGYEISGEQLHAPEAAGEAGYVLAGGIHLHLRQHAPRTEPHIGAEGERKEPCR